MEPRPLPLQRQLSALEHRRSRLRKAKNQGANAAGVRVPERQDDLLAVRAGAFVRRVEYLDAVADLRHVFSADQNHLIAIQRYYSGRTGSPRRILPPRNTSA